jgi:hypothetical protein
MYNKNRSCIKQVSVCSNRATFQNVVVLLISDDGQSPKE